MFYTFDIPTYYIIPIMVFFAYIFLDSEQNDKCIDFIMICFLCCIQHNLSK